MVTDDGSRAVRDRLISSAKSADWRQRASAGRQLAEFAGDLVADQVLAQLLLDAEDTYVTLETAEALLARGDTDGMRLFAWAFASADEQGCGWLEAGLYNVTQSREQVEAVASLCRPLMSDEDDDVRRGVGKLLERLRSA